MARISKGLDSVKALLMEDSIDRFGFRRVTLEQRWFENKPALEHNGDGGVSVGGLFLTRIDITAEEGGWCGVSRFVYEGMPDAPREDTVVAELVTRMVEKPIEVHPKITELMASGQALEASGVARMKFPKWLKSGEKNPFWGVEAYLDPSASYIRTYGAREIPASVAGVIESPAGGDLPESERTVSIKQGQGYNWLRMPVKARWRGTAWEITDEWRKSGRGGWMADIYSKEAMAKGGKKKGL